MCVLVIGDPNGRLREHCLRTRSAPCARFQACLRGHGIDSLLIQGPLASVLVGFAVMQALKFMQGPPFDQQSATMCQCR